MDHYEPEERKSLGRHTIRLVKKMGGRTLMSPEMGPWAAEKLDPSESVRATGKLTL